MSRNLAVFATLLSDYFVYLGYFVRLYYVPLLCCPSILLSGSFCVRGLVVQVTLLSEYFNVRLHFWKDFVLWKLCCSGPLLSRFFVVCLFLVKSSIEAKFVGICRYWYIDENEHALLPINDTITDITITDRDDTDN